MSIDETINKLKSSWCCGYVEDVKIDFEELEELEKMNNKIKELEYEKTQIRKQVYDEIRKICNL